jgi:pimeloyl-ACP methyl ester carboxylesterase
MPSRRASPTGAHSTMAACPTSRAEETSGSVAAGCTLQVGTFTPAVARADAAVVIAPGFAIGPGLGSSRDALDTLGEHLASWGLVTHTVSLCTNGGSIDHVRNDEALAAFGALLEVPVLYAGFSAGGLAAMLAAARAADAEALLALDAVDTGELAAGALDALEVPVHALVGEPSSCNSDGNMLAVYRGRAARVLKVNMAQHFIFEGAACQGFKCALCSGGGEREAEVVRALATAAGRADREWTRRRGRVTERAPARLRASRSADCRGAAGRPCAASDRAACPVRATRSAGAGRA